VSHFKADTAQGVGNLGSVASSDPSPVITNRDDPAPHEDSDTAVIVSRGTRDTSPDLPRK